MGLLTDAEVRMRMWRGDLELWLEEGRFETVFGAGSTSGSPDIAQRVEVEAKVLGISEDTGDSGRPRYGYAQGSHEDGPLHTYGKVLVRFASAIRDRAMVMFGDSTGSTKRAGWPSSAPDPLGAPTLACRFSNRDVLGATDLADACDEYFGYAELQIYGELYPTDIAEVIFCGGINAPATLRSALDDWTVTYDEIEGYPS